MANRNRSKTSSSIRRLKPFVSHSSCARLKRVQGFLCSEGHDALMIIQGIDSRYNEGSNVCLNYLLLDLLSNYSKEVATWQNDDEDPLDDLMVIVKPAEVHVYCNPVNYEILLAYIVSWPNCVIHCMPTAQWKDDQDAAEEFKVRCLVSIMKECQRVTLPFHSPTKSDEEFDKMKVENWPLIQAYALEGFGSGTFFTLRHDLVDVSKELSSLYGIFDAFSTEQYMQKMMQPFINQWQNMNKQIQVYVTNIRDSGSEMKESKMAEPLMTFYEHARISQTENESYNKWAQPFVKLCNNQSGSSSTLTKSSTHMICHGISPYNHLMCTRTYFFDVSSLPAMNDESPAYHNHDIEVLSKVYQAVIECTRKSISQFSTSHSMNKVKKEIVKDIINSLQKSVDCRRLEMSVKLSYTDSSDTDIQENITPGRLVWLLVQVENITGESGLLDGVVFSESFLLSAIQVADDDSRYTDCKVLNITEYIPAWLTWNMRTDRSRIDDYLQSPQSTGNYSKYLVDGQTVDLYCTNTWMQPINCRLYVYDEGITLDNDSIGLITLNSTDIKSVELYDADDISNSALVLIYTTLDYQSRLPRQLFNTQRLLMLSLTPRSKSYKQFYENVVPLWKDNSESTVKLTITKQLNPSAFLRYKLIKEQNFYDTGLVFNIEHTARKMSTKTTSFIDHINGCSSMGDIKITTQDLQVLTTPNYVESTERDIMLIISIITGIPGSFKENVANFITKLTQEKSSVGRGWVIHRQTIDTNHRFDKQKLENSISYVYSNMLKKKSGNRSKVSRMLIITPGFTPIQTVVSTILNHPNKDLHKHIQIGTVTACVDPHNSFLSGRCFIPGLIDQCRAGWTNTIIFTSSSDHGNGNLTMMQNILRSVNPEASQVLTDRGAITRTQDIDLILAENAYNKTGLITDRLLSLSSTGEDNSINTIQLKIYQPLQNSNLRNQLAGLSKKVGEYPFHGAVICVWGRIFIDDINEVQELSYSVVSSSYRLTPAVIKPDDRPACFISFSGILLHEHDMKDFVRKSLKQKPVQQELLSVYTVDQQTKLRLQKQIHDSPLPAGWYYNGSQYVDMLGDKLSVHPNFAQTLQDYIDTENLKRSAHNADIEKTIDVDPFSPTTNTD